MFLLGIIMWSSSWHFMTRSCCEYSFSSRHRKMYMVIYLVFRNILYHFHVNKMATKSCTLTRGCVHAWPGCGDKMEVEAHIEDIFSVWFCLGKEMSCVLYLQSYPYLLHLPFRFCIEWFWKNALYHSLFVVIDSGWGLSFEGWLMVLEGSVTLL